MQWLRRCTLFISICIGLVVLVLVIHTFWMGPQDDPALLGQRVQDLRLLVIILLAWSGLYTVFFLLAPIGENMPRSRLSGSVRETRLLPGEAAKDYPHQPASKCILTNGLAQMPQAIAPSLALDNRTADAQTHYSSACRLALQGELGDAIIELQTAFRNRSPELGLRLAKDTEEGGPLHEMAAREPYDRLLDDLLLHVTIGT